MMHYGLFNLHSKLRQMSIDDRRPKTRHAKKGITFAILAMCGRRELSHDEYDRTAQEHSKRCFTDWYNSCLQSERRDVFKDTLVAGASASTSKLFRGYP